MTELLQFISNPETLIIFALFIVPGYIFYKIFNLTIPSERYLAKDNFTEIIAYSLLNNTPILFIDKNSDYYQICLFFILIILPIIMVFFISWLSKREWFLKEFPHFTKSHWEYAFSEIERSESTAIITFTMNDGSEIIGFFGENSYATSYPNSGSIYLEKTYDDNDDDLQEEGILIEKGSYKSMKIRKLKKGE